MALRKLTMLKRTLDHKAEEASFQGLSFSDSDEKLRREVADLIKYII